MPFAVPHSPAGIGLRAPHYREILETRPAAGFLEIHSENFFCAGGAPLAWLERFRAAYPMSFHGVGLSLGSVDALEDGHLEKLAQLVRRFEPQLVSEHLCWSHAGGRHSNDLLPLPYTEEALAHVAARVGAVQERLGRRILVENVSSYHAFAHSTIPEWEFVAEVARRSGCGLLLDVNNIWVSSRNHKFDPQRYLDAIDPATVGEIHLAGYEESEGLLIDTHSRPVSDAVWALHAETLSRMGPRPTLIEWDADIPSLDVLLGEARKADAIAARTRALEPAA
ncbi:MAG TPA: DUF692 domain-containing protein [Usitatibacter sp.]|nr:DUF692 domain-containing protein [Usitatibacter sp.]